MKGVAPSRAGCTKGIGEFLAHDPVDGVVWWGVKVAGNYGREARVGAILLQTGKRSREFDLSECVILDVLAPTVTLVKVHIGGGREEV